MTEVKKCCHLIFNCSSKVNILVSRDGVAKINDFDCSILSDATLRFSETTKLGGGTLRWMVSTTVQVQGYLFYILSGPRATPAP